MHEIRLEDLLRQTFRDEATALPMTISPDLLQRRLAERRSRARARSTRWLLIAAAVAAVAGAAALVGSQLINLEPEPPDATVTLPATEDMLTGFADATVRLERSVGPADAPLDPASKASPGASPAPVEVGRLKFAGPFVIGVACIGDGQLLAEVVTPSFGFAYTQAVAPCDGKPVFSEYLAAPIDPASDGDTIQVTVSEGASWRLAVGEFPASLITPPEFEPIELTSGWHLVSNITPTLVTTKTGAHITMPEDATRAGVFVQCQGAGSVSVSVLGSPATEVSCEPPGATRRIEFPAVGGEPLGLDARVNGERIWVRMIVEADAEIAATYPSAPPLPAAVAAVPYAVPDPSVVAFGTVGSNRQTMLPISGAQPGMPAGDLLPIAIYDEADGTRLELASVSTGSLLQTLATARAPSLIFDSWADATHDQVFYAMAKESGVEFHRVSADGTDDDVVATVGRGQTGFTADLAVDESVFVVDACFEAGGCTRTIVDGATGSVRQVDRAPEPICRIFGIADGTIIGSTRPVCSEESATDVIAVPVEGGPSTVVIEDAVVSSLEGAFVVPTSEGPKLVLAGPVGTEDGPWDVLDIRSGKTTTLGAAPVGGVTLGPIEIRMPGGWILLAGGAMGDFPWQRAMDRPVPVLMNLVTGERIELVNLPNWTGNYFN